MIKILFVCHGNICRSPMAEFVMKYLLQKEGMEHEVMVASAATSREEIGNDIHIGTKRKLQQEKIPFQSRRAVQIKASDYEEYDFLIGMDRLNLNNMKKIIGKDKKGKLHLLMSFTGEDKDIADPWYTDNFELTYQEIQQGCMALLEQIKSQNPIR